MKKLNFLYKTWIGRILLLIIIVLLGIAIKSNIIHVVGAIGLTIIVIIFAIAAVYNTIKKK